MNTIEVWKAIPGYEGIYEVSDQGNVRSLDRYVYRPTLLWGQAAMTFCEGRELKPQRDKKGYLEICLSNGCKKTAKRFKVHRLVAMAFIPNTDNLPQINHKDEVKTNNNVDNLEWCTNKYNCNYKDKPERGYRNGAGTRRIPVVKYDKDGNEVGRWKSILAAAIANGVKSPSIAHNIRTGAKTRDGYTYEVVIAEKHPDNPIDNRVPTPSGGL